MSISSNSFSHSTCFADAGIQATKERVEKRARNKTIRAQEVASQSLPASQPTSFVEPSQETPEEGSGTTAYDGHSNSSTTSDNNCEPITIVDVNRNMLIVLDILSDVGSADQTGDPILAELHAEEEERQLWIAKVAKRDGIAGL